MELGALICIPKSPSCPSCPLRARCDAFRVGDAESLPIRAKKQPSPKISAVGILAFKDERALFVQRGARELLGGMWELPGGPLKKGESHTAGAKRVLAETLGLELRNARHLGEVHHVFSHRELFLQVVKGSVSGRVQRQGFETHMWRSPSYLAKRAPNSLTKKTLELALYGKGSKAKTVRKA
jgi:A/G-specific adenine glycosylase